jgi:WD40 repeat protein
MRIFLSFNSKDLALAETLRAAIVRIEPASRVFLSSVSLGAGFWLRKIDEELKAADALLLLIGPNGVGPWQSVEYSAAFDRHVAHPDFAVVPVIAAGAHAPGLPFLRTLNWVEASVVSEDKVLHRLIAALKGETVASTTPLWKLVNPYRGLEAMTEDNADYFHGRAAETSAVLSTLASDPGRCPILIGASGVGKSSVARAGVLSALKSMRLLGVGGEAPWPSGLANSRSWVHLNMRPGQAPIEALAAAVTRVWGLDLQDPEQAARPRKWAEAIKRRDNKLRDLIDATQETLKKRDGEAPARILLYVDQGEELYTRADETDARSFSEVLAEGLSDRRFAAFASLRSDYFGKLQADEALFKSRAHVDVAPLDGRQLNDVVTVPPRALGVSFEDDERTADRIIHAAAAAPGALPLLSYLLTDMWNGMVARGDAILRLPAEAIDVGGVLASRAEEFLKADPGQEPALRRLLTLRLATVPPEGEPVRRETTRRECTEAEWALASRLADHPWRLVVAREREPSGEVVAEVAHEALLRAWPRLSEWLRAERDFLIFKADTERDERRWRSVGMTDDALLRGLDLVRAVEWLPKRSEDLSAEVRGFVKASIDFDRKVKEKQIRLQRRFTFGALLAALLLACSTVVAALSWREAESQRAQAEAARKEAQASLWIANARSDLQQGRLESAADFASRAFKELPTAASRSALASALFEVSPHLGTTFNVAAEGADAIAWAADTIVFAPATGSRQLRTIALRNSARGETTARWPLPSLTRAQDAKVAAVRTLRTVGPDQIMVVFDNGALALAAAGKPPVVLNLPASPMTLYPTAHAAAVGQSGSLIATVSVDAGVNLIQCKKLSAAESDCQSTMWSAIRGRAVAISPDETRIALADEKGAIAIYDRTGARIGEPVTVGSSLLALGWASSRNWLAVGDSKGDIVVIDLDEPTRPQVAKASFPEAPISALAWSADGLDLAFVCEAKVVCLWHSETGAGGKPSFAPIRRFAGHTNSVTSLSWSPAGQELASASIDGAIRVWTLAQNVDATTTVYAESAGQIASVAASLDGRWLAGGAREGVIRVWDASSGALARVIRPANASEVASLAWAQSGLLAAAHSGRGITLIPADAAKPVREIDIDTGMDPGIVFAGNSNTLIMPQHQDRRIALLDVGESGLIAKLYLDPIGPVQVPWGVAADPAGKSLFATYTDSNGEIQTFDLATRKPTGPLAYTLPEPPDAVAGSSLSVSHDGRWLAASGGAPYVRLYDLAQKKSWQGLPLDVGSNAPSVAAFSPDGAKLAALAADNRVYVWNVSDSRATRQLVLETVLQRSPVVGETGATASGIAWVTNDGLAIATGISAINIVKLDSAKWLQRAKELAPIVITPAN